MTVTAAEKRQIEEKGYADIGGIYKKKYWTPDGREIRAVPSIRTFNRIVDGKVVEQGTRDANLDRGWLENKPDKLVSYCPNCDKWHNTQAEVDSCGEKKRKFAEEWEKRAIKLKEGESNGKNKEVEEIKAEISELKKMMNIVLEAINGKST